MQTIAKIILVVVTIAVFVWIISWGLDKHSKMECLTWQNQAEEYPGFYLTGWQADQCEAVGVEINAPIIK